MNLFHVQSMIMATLLFISTGYADDRCLGKSLNQLLRELRAESLSRRQNIDCFSFEPGQLSNLIEVGAIDQNDPR